MDPTSAELWLRSRVDRSAVESLDGFLAAVARHLSVATSDAVSIRRLSGDGTALLPIAAHHPDPLRGAAMLEVMRRTTSLKGLWAHAVDRRDVVSWHVPADQFPAEASSAQRAFLHDHTVRAVMGLPLYDGDVLLGGVALIRFTVDRPFTASDERLVRGCASRVSRALLMRRRLVPPSDP